MYLCSLNQTSIAARKQICGAESDPLWSFKSAVDKHDLLCAGPDEVAEIVRWSRQAQLKPEPRIVTVSDTATYLHSRGLIRLGHIRKLDPEAVPLLEQLRDYKVSQSFSLALVIPYGRRYGDTLVYLAFVRTLVEILSSWGFGVRLYLFGGFSTPILRQLYQRAALFEAVLDLPCKASTLLDFDAYMDFTIEHCRLGQTWIDGLFETAGLDPALIPSSKKRNLGSYTPVTHTTDRHPFDVRPVVLFHHEASAKERSIPLEHARRICSHLLKVNDVYLVSTSILGLEQHRNYEELGAAADTFDKLAQYLSAADVIVSVDTSVIHLADALDKPTIGLFVITDPNVYCRYYPGLIPIQLGPLGEQALRLGQDEMLHELGKLWANLDPNLVCTYIRTALACKS